MRAHFAELFCSFRKSGTLKPCFRSLLKGLYNISSISFRISSFMLGLALFCDGIDQHSIWHVHIVTGTKCTSLITITEILFVPLNNFRQLWFGSLSSLTRMFKQLIWTHPTKLHSYCIEKNEKRKQQRKLSFREWKLNYFAITQTLLIKIEKKQKLWNTQIGSLGVSYNCISSIYE